MLLALVPAAAHAEPYDDAVVVECANLWHDRNLKFVRAGLCLGSPLGQAVFAAHSRRTTDAAAITLSDAARARISAIQQREVKLGCMIDTEAETLQDAARNLAVNPGETGQAVREDADHVNVRAGPSTAFEVIDEIALGTPMTVLERGLNPQGTHRWLRVSYPSAAGGRDLEGYVYFRQVEAIARPSRWTPPFKDFPPPDQTAATNTEWRLDPELIAVVPEGLARETLEVYFDDGPNFAESTILTIWGCGTGCAAGGILDLANGVWADLPFIIESDLGQDVPLLDYRSDSTLIVANGWRHDEELGVFPYHWNGHEVYALTDTPEPRPSTIDQWQRVQSAFAEVEYDDAIRHLRGVILHPEEGDAERFEALFAVALAARGAGRFDKGLAAAYRAQDISPDDPEVRDYIASHDLAYSAANPPPTEFEIIAETALDSLDGLLEMLDW
ncbi:MAG: SH3 domain-containing protein [Natronohydrobacter sp.]|nr:SH3 domain-containing protein [Natronohydrobacter sp.]